MELVLFYSTALLLFAPLRSAAQGWTDWSDWDTCSVTCGTGMQKRVRNCPNAIPILQSIYCFGDSTEYRSCSPKPCAAIAFHTYWLRDRSPNPNSGDNIIFTETLVNRGEAYRMDCGVFYAPQDGTYTFFAHVCIKKGTAMSFSIMVRYERYASTYGRALDDCHCSSVQAIATLEKDDKVYVQWKLYDRDTSGVICEEPPLSTFSGVLNFSE